MMHCIRPLLILTLCIFSCSAPNGVKDQEFVGHWEGDCKYGNTAILFTVDINKNDSVYAALFSSDDQRTLNIPLQNVQLFKDSVHFELNGDNSSWVFDGKLEQAKISGLITKGKQTASFLLNKTNLSLPEYTVAEVTFQNDSVILSGTLRQPNTKTKVPAILFMHGSGGEQRFASAYMADFLARKGMATLIYDKRGTGKSTGNWLNSTFEDLANDAIAGIKLLESNPLIDPKKIGIYGHSQGGAICPMVLNMYSEISFGISAASAGVSMMASDWYEVQNRFKNYISGKDYDYAMSVMEKYLQYAATGTGYQELIKEAAKYKSEQWYHDYIGDIDTTAAFFQYYRKIGRYNPVDQWKNVKQASLILKGDNDQTTPAYPTFQNIEDALKQADNNKYKIVIFPNTTHEMHLTGNADDFWFKATPDYCNTIYDWIKNSAFD